MWLVQGLVILVFGCYVASIIDREIWGIKAPRDLKVELQVLGGLVFWIVCISVVLYKALR